MLFSINCLEKISMDELSSEERILVGECDCHLYKNLKSKRYFFNDVYKHDQRNDLQINHNRALTKDFFGPHINVQAIVGENGSGKSSVMEQIYMMINNFSYMFERGHDEDRPGADSLYYIPGLFARLYFSIGRDVFKLESKGLILDLFKNDERIPLKHFSICENSESEIVNDKEIADLIENLFYTIVTNYSIQSFIPTNYIHDVYYFDVKAKKDCLIEAKNAQYDIWINSIFHKNDGYVRSIVLNPYRNNGKIDISNELSLSKDRSCALSIWAKQNKKLYFEPYEYENLKIKPKENFLKNKISHFWHLEPEEMKQFNDLYATDDSCLTIINEDFFKILKNKFNLADDLNISNEIRTDIYRKKTVLYIQLKILTIINRYDQFLDYKNCIKFEKNIEHPKIEIFEGVEKLIDALNLPDSHVTKKLWRAISFLRLNYDAVKKIFFSSSAYNGEIYFDELSDMYIEKFPMESPFVGAKKSNFRKFTDPVRIDRILPPSIFDYDLIFKKKDDVVSYSDLSSGELQMLETLSVHSYHIENILSVKKEYFSQSGEKKFHPKYQCVNLVFDEVEMCFHPDYQRQFLKRLLDLIISMKQNLIENGGCCINIIIVTHSPFILSDIPQSNILYLKDGLQNERNGESFAGNLGDLLESGFFLNGTIGDFASHKINQLIDRIQKQMVKSEDVSLVEKIGDPLLKSFLKRKMPKEVV